MEKTVKYIVMALGLLLLMLASGCAEDEMVITDAREITITAEMPGAENHLPEAGRPRKSVAVASDDNTLGLVTKWKEGDKIQIFVRQNGKVYKVDTPSAVYDISANGKMCAFKFNLPDAINGDNAYDVIGVIGVDAQISGSQVVAASKLKRVPIDNGGEADSPMWCEVTIDKSSVKFNAAFKHLGTYEVLHVKNTSGSSISFRHSGFSAAKKWYKGTDNTVLSSAYDPSLTAASNVEVESKAVTIVAGGTGRILSWYIPSGTKVNEAKLNAVVGSKSVTTSDTKTSSVAIERGKAYHMYVTWDGSDLYFSTTCPDNNHPHAIDFGLPSGTKWACCNVGASSPEDYGGYYAWGETDEKSDYSTGTYVFWNDENHDGAVNPGEFKNLGEDIAGTQYDVAHVKWGGAWHMPTLGQCEELMNCCTLSSVIVTRNGIKGRVVTGPNGRDIFLPTTGYITETGPYGRGWLGAYWSSTLGSDEYEVCAYFLEFTSIFQKTGIGDWRARGRGVRPVTY